MELDKWLIDWLINLTLRIEVSFGGLMCYLLQEHRQPGKRPRERAGVGGEQPQQGRKSTRGAELVSREQSRLAKRRRGRAAGRGRSRLSRRGGAGRMPARGGVHPAAEARRRGSASVARVGRSKGGAGALRRSSA